MVAFLCVILAVIWVWFKSGRPRTGFLPEFGMLLDRTEMVDDFGSWLMGRSFLKGEFRGRKVVILLQYGKKRAPAMVVVSMETHAAVTMESSDFSGDRADREGALALFALEVKHELRLRHETGCLKALWQPFTLFFPGRFDPSKWKNVLEAMYAVAGSIERRAPSPGLSAAG